MEEQRKKAEKQAREIGTAWNPVFESLDQQLGSIPVRQAEYQGRIAESTDAQLSDVEASRARSTESLETEKARGLRNLEDDIRNQMEVAGTKIGVAGAGSSSAVGQASEALARVGQKARGSLLEGVNEQLTSINNLASQERSRIGQWKQDKLGEIVSFFQNKMDLAAFCSAIAGALLAFLWFNIYPARFFMGDTGAVSLGLTLGVVAMLTNSALALFIIVFVYVLESGSVVIQLFSKKFLGRKVFLAAPLHHHFEAIGWPEPKVVMRAWIFTVITATLGTIIAILGMGRYH
jgi:hypothetical protein